MLAFGPAIVGGYMKIVVDSSKLCNGLFVVGSGGFIQWGDEKREDFKTIGRAEVHHTYTAAGLFTIHVEIGAVCKYHGQGSCSVDCRAFGSTPENISKAN